jgi:hypothetical protein
VGLVLRSAGPWILAVLAPGCAVALAILPQLAWRPLELLAAAAPAGLGATFAVAEVVSLVGVPFAPWVTVALVVVGGAVAFIRLRARSARPPAAAANETQLAGLSRLLAVGLLLMGIAFGLTIWVVGIRDTAAVPPNRDSGHHGFYVARIASEETVTSDDVIVSDPITEEPYGYYPLGLHASAALGHRITGTAVSELLTGWVILFATVSYPLGMFVLARRLVPDRLLLPGFVALAAPLFGMFPYKFILWGGLTQIASVAILPVAIALLLEATMTQSLAVATLAGLVTFGVGMVNLSQGLLVAIIAAVLVAGRWLTRNGRIAMRRQVLSLAVAAGTTVVLSLPTLADAAQGAADRKAIYEPNNFLFGDAVRQIFTGAVFAPKQVALYFVALAGFLIAMFRRQFIAWAVAGLVVVFIFLVSATPSLEGLRELSAPWYHSPDRTSGNTVPFVTMFVGVALEAIAVWVATRVRGRELVRAGALAGSVAVVGGTCLVLSLHAARLSKNVVQRAYTELTPTQQGDLDAMRMLSRVNTSGSAVLNQEQDGSLWMYALEGLRPLFTQFVPVGLSSASTADREWLTQHIQEFGDNPRVAELLDRYGIGYVFVNEATYDGQAPTINLGAVIANPRFVEVIHRGRSHVFQITR